MKISMKIRVFSTVVFSILLWSDVCGAGRGLPPDIEITAIRPCEDDKPGFIEGKVENTDEYSNYRVAVYIGIEGKIYKKPWEDGFATKIDGSGTWKCEMPLILDNWANVYYVHLVDSTFDPPPAKGGPVVPPEVKARAVARVNLVREPSFAGPGKGEEKTAIDSMLSGTLYGTVFVLAVVLFFMYKKSDKLRRKLEDAKVYVHSLKKPVGSLRGSIAALKGKRGTISPGDFASTEYDLEQIDGLLFNVCNIVMGVHLGDAVERWLPGFRRKLGHRPITIEHKIGKNLSLANIDEVKDFKIAVDNLIDNAIDAKPSFIEIEISEKNKTIEFAIRDDGIGIDPSALHGIRSALEGGRQVKTTKSAGSGFGLKNAFDTIGRIGGRFRIDSETGKGTEITMTIPARK